MKKLAYLSFALLLTACGSETPETDEPVVENETDSLKQEQVDVVDYPQDAKFNDLSNLVAGVEGGSESSLSSIEAKSTWQSYKTSMDGLWKKTNEKLPIMRKWSESEMGEANEGGGTLFYPFSGPDFLHADVFFPEYENIVMIGLEPIGTYPDMIQKSAEGKDQVYLNGVRRSMHMILGKSFFRTIAMADDFNGWTNISSID